MERPILAEIGESGADSWDVVILGGGLAGLSLARQLLLDTDARVLVLDRRDELPGPHQKVGESLVQVGGYYFSKVLQLEEHLFTRHFLKYNLRFYWTTAGRENRSFEDYSASYIRNISNIPCFQLDRNLLESHLLELCEADERFACIRGARKTSVELADDGLHRVRWEGGETSGAWLVDAGGRAAVLRRQLELDKPSPIRHGATWCWVDGLVDIDKLTELSASQVRTGAPRRALGHFPQFLATNHFCAEGQWFWVIPLHGKTSLGLVYDQSCVDAAEVSTGRKMLEYVCRTWPLFSHDLPQRRVVDEGRFLRYSFDAKSAINSQRWALTGEAARFSDPLYSPGSDLIAIQNTLITECVRGGFEQGSPELQERCELYDLLMRALYEAYVPSYSVSYDCLGDQEAFTLKYTWELAIYFGFYVLPLVNDLFAEPRFARQFLRRFAALGSINHRVHHLLSDYYQWKKENRPDAGDASVPKRDPLFKEFCDLTPLREAEKLFYETGLTSEAALDLLDEHLDRMKEFARYIAAHIAAASTGNPDLTQDRAFVEGLRLRKLTFEGLRNASPTADSSGGYPWRLDADAMDEFLEAVPVMETAG